MAFLSSQAQSQVDKLVSGVMERKGSLSLRSDHMQYSLKTLNSNWHKDLQAEPKDYDITTSTKKNQHIATYVRILDVTDGKLLTTTTTQAANDQLKLKRDFEARDIHKSMVTTDNYSQEIENKRLDPTSTGQGVHAIVPRHPFGHNATSFQSTYIDDYVYRYPYQPKPEIEETTTFSNVNRRQLSPFIENDGHRRPGVNTWQDA